MKAGDDGDFSAMMIQLYSIDVFSIISIELRIIRHKDRNHSILLCIFLIEEVIS